jgi:hypothetical protein
MKTVPFQLILILSISIGIGACQHAPMEHKPDMKPEISTQELRKILEAQPAANLLPELASRSPAEWSSTSVGAQLLASSKEAAAVTYMPETTYTRYRLFKTTGERAPYDRPYGQKRSLLSREVLAAWFQGDNSRIDRINDLIWSICEETTWVGPAHEKTEWHIDLYAAETAADLGYVIMLIGDRLPEEVRERVRKEVNRRIFEPYLAHAHEYWWDSGRNNWTGVCAGSIGEAFLLLENDVQRQAKALSLVIGQLDRFIQNAFEADGGCLEGIGYWNYGLYHYVCLAEMLRVRSGGAIDLLSNEKVRAIAAYPLAVVMGKDTYASFSDAHEHSSVQPFLAARLSERAGATGLRALVEEAGGGDLAEVLRNLSWWDGTRPEMPKLDNSFLPVSGLARLVGNAGEHTVVLAVKAGHNAESHNHNDVGSFVLAVDDTVYLCDPGAGAYNAAYFSPKRYENVFANSYGHSVPRIGGTLQPAGQEYCGTMQKTGDKSISIRFEKAYAVPSLKTAVRSIEMHGGEVILQDSFAFEGDGCEVEEAFMTWNPVEINGNVACVTTDKGTLEIRAENGTFTGERLEEACKANKKEGVLTRIAGVYPASTQIEARFSMMFHAKD